MSKISRRKVLKNLAAGGLVAPFAGLPAVSPKASFGSNLHQNQFDIMLLERIKQQSDALFNETCSNREHLHMYPELSHKETNTVQWIAEKLRNYGIQDVETREAGIGVLAKIKGKKPGNGKRICLRADIDALPKLEKSNQPYCSKIDGAAHLCGHDWHSANLISAGRILQNLREEFSGEVICLFQRGEEYVRDEDGKSGATLAMENGLIQAAPSVIFGQHATAEIDNGKIAFFPTGQIGSMAASDQFKHLEHF